jgi:hypothetical protein
MTTENSFGGKVGRSYAESEEWWAEPVRPHPDAPNVIIFLLDDVGFAQLGQSFGGLIETPNIDRLAEQQLGVTVGVINPQQPNKRSRVLKGTFFKQLRPSVLAQCQLPNVITDAYGTFRKPASW